jgi:hypothetical protein
MIQILRSPNVINDSQKIRNALGFTPWPRIVSDRLYRLAWRCQRFHSDFHLLHILHLLSRRVHRDKPVQLGKFQQWLYTGSIAVLAGLPYTPIAHYKEELLMDLLQTQPSLAALVMAGHFGLSVILIRYLFLNVLDVRRFRRNLPPRHPHIPPSHYQ